MELSREVRDGGGAAAAIGARMLTLCSNAASTGAFFLRFFVAGTGEEIHGGKLDGEDALYLGRLGKGGKRGDLSWQGGRK